MLFEIGLVGALRSGDGWVTTNRAHLALISLFDWAGVRAESLRLPALSLPAAALVAVLLSWQVMSRLRWSVHLPTVGGMAMESILSALPVVAVGWVIASIPFATAPEPRQMGVAGQIAVALGAGIYEEFVFRLILVSLLHSFLRRVCRASDRTAVVVAIVISAALFTVYHPISRDGAFALRDAMVLFTAGAWWGTLFVVRGFGIAVGSHAAYDAIVLLLPKVV